MLPWIERPPEIANLINPAFCSVLVVETARAYKKVSKRSLPYSLAFLVLPLVLHKATRLALPKTISSKLHPWIEQNQELKIQFPGRVRQMVPYTREALIWSINSGFVVLDEDARLDPTRKQLRGLKWPAGCEAVACRDRAGFVGRWFAHSGDALTIFVLWGIQP